MMKWSEHVGGRLFISILILMLATSARADLIVSESNALKDYNATNPGKELLVPYETFTDSNSDGLPDLRRLQFDIYPLGSAVRLYSSTPKSFFTPLPSWIGGCNLADLAAWQPGNSRLLAGPRVVASGGISYKCLVGGSIQSYDAVFVYGARVDVPNGASWRYQTAGVFDSAALHDSDNDGSFEQILVVVSVPVVGGSNLKIIYLNVETGAVLNTVQYRSRR